MNDEHVIDLLPEYALGVLQPEDMTRVQNHLGECLLCADEWRLIQSAADHLVFSVPQITPPPGLKAKIMDAAAQTLSQNQVTESQSFLEWLSNGFKRITPAWSIISLILVIALGFSTIMLWQQVQEQEALTEISFVTISLESTDKAPGASGLIVVPQEELDGTLIINHLSSLDEDLQYQLWLIRDGVRTSGAVFSVDAEGYALVRLELPQAIDTYDSFGITIEPAGGSASPTGDKVLGGTI